MLDEPAEAVRARAERLAGLTGRRPSSRPLRARAAAALPLAEIESYACALELGLAEALRLGEPPIVGIVRDDRLLLDCRTLTDAEVDEVAAGRGHVPLTVGTAGHIDHGKTWLVRALTGKDTDRLPGGEGFAGLDRPRLRAARAARRPAGSP